MPPRSGRVGRPKNSKNKKSTCLNAKDIETSVKTDDEHTEVLPVDLVCDKCGISYKRKNCFLKHKRVCKFKLEPDGGSKKFSLYTKKPIYNCRECKKKFKFMKSYKYHMSMEHSRAPGSVACDQCSVRCPDEDTLKQHVADYHDRDIFQCDFCPRTFVRRAHVLRHMAQKGCDGKSRNIYPCEICNAEFSRRDNLAVHLRMQHILKKEYKCKMCSFSSQRFSKLVVHVRNKHMEKPSQYECDHCGKITSSRAAIAKHLEIHGEKKYACDVCGYATYTIEVIRRHVFTHFDEKPYKCSLCSASFIQQQQLKRHLEKHTGNMCQICGNTFKSKTAFDIHKREHKGLEKLYCPYENCPIPHREFPNEVSLMSHMKTHSKKQYRCELCDKSFSSEVNMRRHIATHKLERPRRCMYCVSARAYVRGEQLVKHVRKVHKDVFRSHLVHVRQVLGLCEKVERVSKSELDSILNVLDAEADRILQGYSGTDVLYGGMETVTTEMAPKEIILKEEESSPLMSEDELAENLKLLLNRLVDHSTLKCFGWPDENVDVILEKVIEQCGAKPADRDRWTRVQRLRENAKHLFLYVIEDKNIGRMLDTHTIDQTVKHILKKFNDDEI